MARKRKGELPSGNIRVRIYDYTDLDGKRHYQSFTGRTKQMNGKRTAGNDQSAGPFMNVSEATST